MVCRISYQHSMQSEKNTCPVISEHKDSQAPLAFENCPIALGDLPVKIAEFFKQESKKINLLTEYTLEHQGLSCFSLKKAKMTPLSLLRHFSSCYFHREIISQSLQREGNGFLTLTPGHLFLEAYRGVALS